MKTWAVTLGLLNHHFPSVLNKEKGVLGQRTETLKAYSFSLRIVSKCFRRTHQLWVFGHQDVLEGDRSIRKKE